MTKNNLKKHVHVSPGIYYSESELPIATKSLGITHCGVVGETLRGPAFQVMDISDWRQYQSYFGGTSTEKFRGSQYPKYELPYIAKTYLTESKSLKVCRVLGLSGVNAGPAWFITAYKDTTSEDKQDGKETKEQETAMYSADKPMIVAIIRSRGEHKKASFVRKGEGDCDDVYKYDGIEYFAKEVKIIKSEKLKLGKENCRYGYNEETNELTLDVNNYGTFALEVTRNDDTKKVYSVSFNPSDKNYIYNVIGGNPEIGEAEIYVEELYDVALKQLIERGELNTLGTPDRYLTKFIKQTIIPKHKPVDEILSEDPSMLKRKDVGRRLLSVDGISTYKDEKGKDTPFAVKTTKDGINWVASECQNGHVYTVVAFTRADGTREYFYGEYEGKEEILEEAKVVDGVVENVIFNYEDGLYYINVKNIIKPITLDLNNYREPYRYSSTPWVVSEIKGSGKHVELTKLFRFHTISDGNSSSTEIKVSIENIEPDNGTFDVIIRDFNDIDASPIILERFKACDLVPGSPNYIGLKIGSFDDSYETKSRYVTVEVNENDVTKLSIPAGFLGYPIRNYSGNFVTGTVKENNKDVDILRIQPPMLQYNTNLDDEIRIKKQYFGMSDLVGIDEDVLKYKGVEAYNGLPTGLTPCFHLDSRIFSGKPQYDNKSKEWFVYEEGLKADSEKLKQVVSVDGITGYEWSTVGKNNVNSFGVEPRIGNEEIMLNTIYEDKRTRKFTMCFYGGFDGWDYYRTSRSNSDDFKIQKYRGEINNATGSGANFSVIYNPEAYGFENGERILNSDYYAYLSAIKQFANPKDTNINVFATPGIDYVNNKSLVTEAVEMIDEQRADSIYVITTPDKPFGAGDSKLEMFNEQEVVDNLEDSEIDSNYACTYYPWLKYFDETNNEYIYLPMTKDVLKNFAYTDNIAGSWFAAAGWNRGITDGIAPKKKLLTSGQDILYDGRINYINNFADEGMRIWGDKNLQKAPSQAHLNRISKRRTLIRLRKLISIACIGLIFDPNDNTTISSFRSAVQPILEDFITKRALTDAKLVIDDSEEARDRLEINAQIYLKLMPNTEYINIGLIATPQGVSFDDI